MILENRYYDEVTLYEMLHNRQISWLDFVRHHSPEKKEEYEEYCRERALPETPETAEAFEKYLLQMEDQSTDELD